MKSFGLKPLYFGAALVGIALAIEHASEKLRGTAEHPASWLILTSDTAILWVAEVGYAFIIAWIVSSFIEQRAARAHMKSLDDARAAIETDVKTHLAEIDRRQELVLTNVFAAAAGVTFPVDYVKTVLSSGLSATVVREDYDISWRLEPLSAEQANEHGAEVSRFVLLHGRLRYIARNLLPNTNSLSIRYGLPVRRGPIGSLTQMHALTVGSRKYTKEEIDALSSVDDEMEEIDYPVTAELGPNESVEFLAEVVIVKEMSDSEVFGFRDPTMRCTLRVANNVPGLHFSAKARAASDMRLVDRSADGRTAEWRIDGSILPKNSLTVWWRTEADEGQNVAPEPQPSQSLNLNETDSASNETVNDPETSQ